MSKKKIQILVAKNHGFCGNDKFGVRASVKIAEQAAKNNPGKVFLLGEIVHNSHVVDRLEKDFGVKTVNSLAKIPKESTVIIRAHGVAPEVFREAKKRSLKIIDATCPIVIHSHRQAKSFADQGKTILYISSKKTHDEAVGVAGENPEKIILTTLNEVLELKIIDPANTVVMTQTTLSELETKDTLLKLKEKYPQLTIISGICAATTMRQRDVIDLAKRIGFVIIVGHPTSSNSNRLREVAQEAGAESYIVDTAKNLQKDWFKGKKEVGVSSGASTPEWLLDQVIEKIKIF